MSAGNLEVIGGDTPDDSGDAFVMQDSETIGGLRTTTIAFGGLEVAVREHGWRLSRNHQDGSHTVKSIFTVGITRGFGGEPGIVAFPVTVIDALDAPEISAAVQAHDKYKEYIK